ncbi:MAG: hypothetical protein FD123_4370 [Bacteroidetes bacterium]|nr:MAG: hypothetical protein FD123_4370 [Bacteroidota bacterium]
MHDIEPHYNWRHLYTAEEDERSPFFGREYSEFEFTNSVYNYLLHPQWDDYGSSTLFIKILYTDYDDGYCIIELIGEWNDAINNDIMILKRDIIEPIMAQGINKFILIGDNVLNFHYSDDSYYEEWFDELGDGWIALLNFREHIIEEMKRAHIDYFLVSGGELEEMRWRTLQPLQLYGLVQQIVNKRIG